MSYKKTPKKQTKQKKHSISIRSCFKNMCDMDCALKQLNTIITKIINTERKFKFSNFKVFKFKFFKFKFQICA